MVMESEAHASGTNLLYPSDEPDLWAALSDSRILPGVNGAFVELPFAIYLRLGSSGESSGNSISVHNSPELPDRVLEFGQRAPSLSDFSGIKYGEYVSRFANRLALVCEAHAAASDTDNPQLRDLAAHMDEMWSNGRILSGRPENDDDLDFFLSELNNTPYRVFTVVEAVDVFNPTSAQLRVTIAIKDEDADQIKIDISKGAPDSGKKTREIIQTVAAVVIAICAAGTLAFQATTSAASGNPVPYKCVVIEQPISEELRNHLFEKLEDLALADLEGETETERAKKIQRTLHELGYDPGPIDGDIGPLTEAAANEFLQGLGINLHRPPIDSERFRGELAMAWAKKRMQENSPP